MSYGLYIHIPFCRKKCPYCNFASIAGNESILPEYAEAVSSELQMRCTGTFEGYPKSVYIGGGTPSIVPVTSIKMILSRFLPLSDIECTIEANPESTDESWLGGVFDLGVNRISIGVQSLDDTILSGLGRIHTAHEARKAVLLARSAGFRNISVDLMFGIPGQTMALWKKTLEDVLDLKPDHVSCYSLSIEEDSGFFEMRRNKDLCLPGPGETSDMYLYMSELLEEHGLERYEISNFARPGYECLHNSAYWNFIPYLGIGASAHSFDGTIRRWNESEPVKYIELCRAHSDPVYGSETIDDYKRIIETVMLSLRTRNGLSVDRISAMYPFQLKQPGNKIDMLVEAGFLERCDENNVRLSTKGVVISDEIITEIVSDITPLRKISVD